MNMLEVENLAARHGLLTAVRDVSFSVQKGEVLGVVGANGAGKTTLFRAIAGVHAAAVRRSIRLEWRGYHRACPRSSASLAGIAMVPEGRRLFADMTVRENLQVAGENGRKGSWTLKRVLAALPALKPHVGALAASFRAASGRRSPSAAR